MLRPSADRQPPTVGRPPTADRRPAADRQPPAGRLAGGSRLLLALFGAPRRYGHNFWRAPKCWMPMSNGLREFVELP